MSENDSALAALHGALNSALAAHDATAESVARVNIACAYLQLKSPQARPAFEAALSSVRKAQNPRSEGILSMVFAPYFVELGDPGRALELARRGAELCRRARLGQRVLSMIQLARVLYTGFSDPEQAGEAVDQAVAALAQGPITHPTDQQVVVEAAGQAALAAVQAGDMARALALARMVDPAVADKLERQQAQQPQSKLGAAQREELSKLYSQWRGRFGAGKAAPKRIAEMNRKAQDMLHWDERRARQSVASGDADAVGAFVERAMALGAGGAGVLGAAGAVTDDDLVFTLALATDSGFNKLLPGWAVFQLVGENAKDPALAGRCLRLVSALYKDPGQQLKTLQRADALLAKGADDALRAEVTNEMAVCHLNLRQAEPALATAQRAVDLARRLGDPRLGRMARGNVANALLQLQRVADALKMFEALAHDQEAAGERDMAGITRRNIEACRAYLLRNPGRP